MNIQLLTILILKQFSSKNKAILLPLSQRVFLMEKIIKTSIS